MDAKKLDWASLPLVECGSRRRLYNAADPQTGYNRLGFSGEGPQVWQNNQAFVVGISQSFTDESIRWPQPINPGDITSNYTRSPFGAGPPSNFADWVNDFSNGADH